jgi:hypothetical protein
MKNKLDLFKTSTWLLLYFVIIITMSAFDVQPNVFAHAVIEWITIPAVIGLIVFFIISIKDWYKTRFQKQSVHLKAIMIQLLTMALLILATWFKL